MLSLFLFSVFFVVLPRFNAEIQSKERRNTLLIVADDAGFQIGAYRNKICQTPNLDALAKDSLIFNNAYTSVSSCSPSRSAILTGIPSHKNGMYGLHQGEHHFDSFNNIKSLPMVLKSKGITTGIIGKKHVGPEEVYPFDFAQTEENNSILQVGRNITKIKLLVAEFLKETTNSPFFLYIGLHDPHRCGHTNPLFGEFCQRFGNGEEGMGLIPDWRPIHYVPDQLQVPYYVPDTLAAREDMAAQFTTMSRLDQGVGLILQELEAAGLSNDTLVIFTSDNGIPFPNGRTNLYDSGLAEPMFIRSPVQKSRRNQVTYSLSSLLDIVPTILDWHQINRSDFESSQNGHNIVITGRSLLPLLDNEPTNYTNEAVFASHNLHEITMYYPMRAVRTKRYKLIHNLNYLATFPIDQDFYLSPTFQDILNRTRSNQPTYWFKTLKNYYQRPEWELFDLKFDPEELNNVADKESYASDLKGLKGKLYDWQKETNDPWICAPHAVLQDKGDFKDNPQCMSLDNLEIEHNFLI